MPWYAIGAICLGVALVLFAGGWALVGLVRGLHIKDPNL